MGALLPAALQATEDAGNQKSPAKFSSHVQQAPAIHLRARCKPRAAPEPPVGSCSAPATSKRLPSPRRAERGATSTTLRGVFYYETRSLSTSLLSADANGILFFHHLTLNGLETLKKQNYRFIGAVSIHPPESD